MLLEALPRLGWGDVAPADGAFYLYADLGPWVSVFGSSVEYCAALLEEAFVALTPGVDFDGENGRRFVRLSFAAGFDAVSEAITRIVAFQEQYAQS